MKQQADRTRQQTIEKDEMAVAHAKEAHALREQLEQERAMHHQTCAELDMTRTQLEIKLSELESQREQTRQEQELIIRVNAELSVGEVAEREAQERARLIGEQMNECQLELQKTIERTHKLESDLDAAHGLLGEQQKTAEEACAELRMQNTKLQCQEREAAAERADMGIEHLALGNATRLVVEQERAQAAQEIAVLQAAMQAAEAEHTRTLQGALQHLEAELRAELRAEGELRLMSQAQATLAAEDEIDRLTDHLRTMELEAEELTAHLTEHLAAADAPLKDLAVAVKRAETADAEIASLKAAAAANEAEHATNLGAVQHMQAELERELAHQKARADNAAIAEGTKIQALEQEVTNWKSKAKDLSQEKQKLEAECTQISQEKQSVEAQCTQRELDHSNRTKHDLERIRKTEEELSRVKMDLPQLVGKQIELMQAELVHELDTTKKLLATEQQGRAQAESQRLDAESKLEIKEKQARALVDAESHRLSNNAMKEQQTHAAITKEQQAPVMVAKEQHAQSPLVTRVQPTPASNSGTGGAIDGADPNNRLNDLKAWAQSRVAQADRVEVDKAQQMIHRNNHALLDHSTLRKAAAMSENLVTEAVVLVSKAEMRSAGGDTARELCELARLRQKKREAFMRQPYVSPSKAVLQNMSNSNEF